MFESEWQKVDSNKIEELELLKRGNRKWFYCMRLQNGVIREISKELTMSTLSIFLSICNCIQPLQKRL